VAEGGASSSSAVSLKVHGSSSSQDAKRSLAVQTLNLRGNATATQILGRLVPKGLLLGHVVRASGGINSILGKSDRGLRRH
jgi:hypothetical protein